MLGKLGELKDDGKNITVKITKKSNINFLISWDDNKSVTINSPKEKEIKTTDGIGSYNAFLFPIEYKGPNALIKIDGNYNLADSNENVIDGRGKELYYDELGNQKILMSQGDYFLIVPKETSFLADSTISVIFNFTGTNEIPETQQIEEKEELFEKIEKIMSDFILSIARVINWLMGKVVGRQLTLDDLIFNNFSEIRLDFFKTDIFGNKVNDGSLLIMGEGDTPGLREPITIMYNFFKSLALIGYLVILIYMGMKIMLSSTAAKKKATYKETFKYWVTGVIILFFMPYFMKYVIALDESIVKYISDDSGIRSQASREGQENASQFNKEADKGFLKTEFEGKDGDISKSVIDYSGKDYMSSIGKLASRYHKLGYSIAFLILTWQIITLLIYYYKRVFITALLIMIFPLIAFTYTWDKLNDGKSQALSAWMREFSITVFVQVFHAIVYVFITNTIYATIQTTSDGNPVNADFILLIIASSFLFAGEDILKKLFGGGGESLGSATQSATKIAFITSGAVALTTKTVKNVFGKDGNVRAAVRSIKEAKTNAYLAGNTLKDKASKILTGNTTTPPMEILAKNQARHNGIGEYLPKEGNISPTIKEAGEMLYDLNNSSSAKDFSNALDKYHKLRDARNGVGVRSMTDYEKRQFDEMMKKSGISLSQLDNLDTAMEDAAATAAAIALTDNRKAKMQRISQKLRIDIEAIFPLYDDKGNKITGANNAFANKVMNAALLQMNSNGISPTKQIRNFEEEWNKKLENIRHISDSVGFKMAPYLDIIGSIERRQKISNGIMSEYTKNNPDMTSNERKNAKKIATHVAVLSQTFDKDANQYQVALAFKEIEQNNENVKIAKDMMRIAGVDEDIDTLKFVLTERIKASTRDEKAKAGIERKTLFSTSKNKQVDDFINARRDEIFKRYAKAVGKMSTDQEKEARIFALNLAKVENYDMGFLSSSEIKDSMDSLNENQLLTNKMIEAAGIEKDYEQFKQETDNLIDVTEWASNSVKDVEEQIDNNQNFSIIDVVEAAKEASGEEIDSVENMIDRASRDDASEKVIERKRDNYNKSVRERTRKLSVAAQKFAEFALEDEGYNKNPARTPTEEIKLDGLTVEEMNTLSKQNRVIAQGNIGKVLANTVVKPVTTFTGFAIGAAVTDDFMPLEESLIGAISGNKVGEQPTKTIDTMSAEKERQAKIQKIKDSVNSRIKSDEQERLNAKTAFEDAAYKSRDGLDGTLTFAGANATMHLETNGTISATINMMANNAAFMSISEDAPIPSSGWQPYQESAYYQFKDKNSAKPHTLYIYVRDRSGNILGKKISGIHL